MVFTEKGSNLFWQSRSRILVFPTPESPTKMILILYYSPGYIVLSISRVII
jgi:hypothetical protein